MNKITLLLFFALRSAQALTFGLDCWHNNESGNPTHYKWALSSCDMGSYCGLGTLIKAAGHDTVSVTTALSANTLSGLDALIIVDPDTPSETASPNYITGPEADAVEAWVRGGGVLLMLANDAGNCEFTNLNGLSDRFGIHFNSDQATATGDLTGLPVHPFFEGCATIHWVNVCTMALSDSAQSEFSMNSQVLAASTRFGMGRVLTFGDPIWYNEYLNTTDNNRFARNVVGWLADTTGPSEVRKAEVLPAQEAPSLVAVYDITGKRVAGFKSAGIYLLRYRVGKSVFFRKTVISR
jgi:hypothetical protein